jgi:hypothetical protein
MKMELGPDDVMKLAEEFDDFCRSRAEEGAAEYGPVAFLGNDVITMMMEEIADISNYCRFQFVKLRILQEAFARASSPDPSAQPAEEGTTDRLSFGSPPPFTSASDLHGIRPLSDWLEDPGQRGG